MNNSGVFRQIVTYCICAFGLSLVHSSMAADQQTIRESAASLAPRDSYADVVERVAPAVVTIHSAQRLRPPQQFPFLNDPFFRQFFGDPNQGRRQETLPTQESVGSGVIASADGYILTNQHVIDGADRISVELSDRRTFSARLVGADAPSDLALLKIEARGLPVLPLGDSDKVRVGDVCLAIGNPLGIGETVTSGIISARGRTTGLSDGSFEDFLQTDAAINQGNSGGALINTRGEMIGINSQIISMSGGGSIGIGFAIPSNMASNVMQQLEHGGKVRRGNLGAGIQAITPQLAKTLGMAGNRGALVNSVEAGGAAERAGIRAGDVITAINGHGVEDPNALRNAIANFAPATEVRLTVVTKGQEREVQVRLSELGQHTNAPAGPGTAGARLGVTVEPLASDVAPRLGLPPGIRGITVMSVDPQGVAAHAGVLPGDVILEVNHQSVVSAAELSAALRKSGSPMLLLINRRGVAIFLAIDLLP